MSTVHILYADCDPDIKNVFDEKVSLICPEGYESVSSMNEFYISTRTPEGSDKVFETPHVDGPFWMFPNVLLRCIYVLQENKHVRTNIPCIGFSKVLRKDEYVMFDYNRDIHNIEYAHDETHDCTDRIVLKLHFVKKELFYTYFAKLNTMWNTFARKIFIASKTPTTLCEHTMACVINTSTRMYTALLRTPQMFNVTALCDRTF